MGDRDQPVRSRSTAVEASATTNVETDPSVAVRVEFRPVLQCGGMSTAEPSPTALPTGHNMLEFPAPS